MLTAQWECDRNTLQMCRDECELFEFLEKEDPRDGTYDRYRNF